MVTGQWQSAAQHLRDNGEMPLAQNLRVGSLPDVNCLLYFSVSLTGVVSFACLRTHDNLHPIKLAHFILNRQPISHGHIFIITCVVTSLCDSIDVVASF